MLSDEEYDHRRTLAVERVVGAYHEWAEADDSMDLAAIEDLLIASGQYRDLIRMRTEGDI